MKAGRLDRRVKILRLQAGVPNELNEVEETWQEVAEVWAQQRPDRGSERFAAAQVAGTSVMTFHIRYRSDVTVRDRLEYEGRVYEIIAPPREIGRREMTEIDAVARADD
jgi:SPP1 family predicted phage head-tail adaptor